MSAQRWRIEEPPAEEVAGVPPTVVASISYLAAALRRRWRTWLALTLAGLLLGLVVAVAIAPGGTATTTLLLAHPDGTDPASAMQTDLSILRTRTVAERTVAALHSSMPASAFQDRIQATAVTSTVMSITVSAANPTAAVRQARALATSYLAFRATQLQAQSKALVSGYQAQIDAAQQQVATLTTQYNALSNGDANAQAEAADDLSRRSQLAAQIITLQQQISASTLSAGSISQASHVLDPAIGDSSSKPRRAALLGASGLIGGLFLGVGLVLFGALTSFRLRRREEVALAIGAPVRYAAAGIRRRPGVGRKAAAHGHAVLSHGLEAALRTTPARLALVTVGQTAAEDAARLLADVGTHLSEQRRSVVLVDLGERPRLTSLVRRLLSVRSGPGGPVGAPAVVRPDGVAALAPGPLNGHAEDGTAAAAAAAADVVLTLLNLDPDAGADELPGWTDRAVLLVEAGRSTPEQLRTAAELLRSAGVELEFAMLLRSDATDESLGRPRLVGLEWRGRS